MRSKQEIERQIAHFKNDCVNKGTEANAIWVEDLEWVLGDEEHQQAYKEFLDGIRKIARLDEPDRADQILAKLAVRRLLSYIE